MHATTLDLVVVGPSGAGKSSIIKLLMTDTEFLNQCTLISRYTTRTPRQDEVVNAENVHMSRREIQRLDRNDRLSCIWARNIGSNAFTTYAFPRSPGESSAIAIYPGNESLLTIEIPFLSAARRRVVLMIEASDAARRHRILSRVDRISDEEIEARIGRIPPSEWKTLPDVTIWNEGRDIQHAIGLVKALARGLLTSTTP